MTRIEFYFNVTDKPALTIKLVQAAVAKRKLVTVSATDEAAAQQLSALLWQADAASFVPNLLANEALAAQTPVVLHWQNQAILQDELLINVSENQPSFFSQFTELIEIVGTNEQDKAAARTRYKFYRDRGYEIKNTDQAK